MAKKAGATGDQDPVPGKRRNRLRDDRDDRPGQIAVDGGLKRIGIEPSLGKGPQNLLITPDGGLLLCANMPGNNVVVFRINRKTGALKAVGEPVSVPKPSCIRLLE